MRPIHVDTPKILSIKSERSDDYDRQTTGRLENSFLSQTPILKPCTFNVVILTVSPTVGSHACVIGGRLNLLFRSLSREPKQNYFAEIKITSEIIFLMCPRQGRI